MLEWTLMNFMRRHRLSVAHLHAVAAGASNRRLLVWPESLSAKYSTDVLFVPYLSADCIALHSAVAESIQRNGWASSAVCLVDPKSLLNQRTARSPSAAAGYYGERISELAGLAGHGADVVRGYVDQYRRTIPVEAFFDKRPLDAKLVTVLYSLTDLAWDAVSRCRVIVLPDLAYALNRSIAEFARQQSKRLFLLNPHGRFREVNLQSSFAVESDHSLLFDTGPTRELDPRGRPTSSPGEIPDQRDWNVQAAMESADGALEIAREATTIFLHCIRDAAQDPINLDRIGEVDGGDFFQWTVGVLGAAAREPGAWLIKPHPSMDRYPGERAIVSRAVSTIGLEQRSRIRGPSRRQVLENQLKVLTHTGTIALECAASGFRAFSTSSMLPAHLVKRVGKDSLVTLDSIKELPVDSVGSFGAQSAANLISDSTRAELPASLLVDSVALPQASLHRYLLEQVSTWRAARSRYSSLNERREIDFLGSSLIERLG